VNGNAIGFNQQFAYAVVRSFGYKPKTVAIQYDTGLTDQRGYIKIFGETWERLGVKVASTDVVNLTDADCTSTVQKWRSLNVDWVQFMGLGYLLCLPAMQRAGWKPNVGIDAWASSVAGLADLTGPGIEGVVTAWEGDRPTDGKPRQLKQVHKDITRGFAKYHPSLNKLSALDSPPVRSMWVTLTVIEQWLGGAGSDLSPAAFIKFAQGRTNYDVGIDPPIQSWNPNCKKGTDALAFGRWHWDAEKQTASREPETGYIGPAYTPEIAEWSKNYGGDCYVTKASDAGLRL
jgi:Periplasmic binding protein